VNFKNTEKGIRIATVAFAIFLLCFGMAMAFFPIRPFWNDEWRLIYNLKFKTESQLWGRLDLLQQCPRVYLTLLKKITSLFDYSYTSLRLPALVVSAASIPFCFYLRKRIFPVSTVYSYLFVLIFISSQTFTDYLVQTKQYEMELLLCLLALWQLITLLEISEVGRMNKYKYLLLCISFLVAPFFSYTYPIAVAPIFPVIVFSSVISLRNSKSGSARLLLSLLFPLAIAVFSIVVFYFIDVKQLMADNSMYLSYQRMLGHGQGENHFIENFWQLFSLVGSGLIFEIIFGVLGMASFFYGVYRLAKTKKQDYTRADHLRLYAVLLLVLTLGLFLSGKLLGGVARLTAYTVPSISLLIIAFLSDIKATYKYPKPANIISGILFAGLFGNIISVIVGTFTYPAYRHKIETYWHTSQALKEARLAKIPILITDGVRGEHTDEPAAMPGKISTHTITAEQIRGVDVLCAEVVVKVNPEYRVWDTVAIYTIPDVKWTAAYMQQLPAGLNSAIVGDGVDFVRMGR